MEDYRLFNTYARYNDFIKDAIFMEQTPSIVDFGTAMANKCRTKRNRRK